MSIIIGGGQMSPFYCWEDELELIRDYASVFGKGNCYYYYIFSKGGFTDGLLQAQERGEVRLITLEDLYR